MSDAQFQELVLFLARGLADHPEQVEVDVAERGGATILELSVAPGDLGKVIGRQGRTAQAIRTLLAVVAAEQGKRVILDILD